MKENPTEKKIRNNLKPGQLTISGFMGEDKRDYSEVIASDRVLLNKLGYDEKKISSRMQFFTDFAFESFDGTITWEDNYKIQYETFRGKLICPFAHSGVFRKGYITVTNLKKSISISWSPLNIHMIEEHCFFEGKGSEHRLDPQLLIETIF